MGARSTGIRTGAERTLELLEAQVGRPLGEVETPVAVVDLDRLEANLQRLQSYADSHAIALWPHTKTHKSPEIGLRQLALGAGGLTVAKTGEAEVFHEAGAPRLLVHYPPFGADKWDRLARLAAEGLELTVAVDSLAPADGLSAALKRRGATAELLVELDVGLHRTGQVTRRARSLSPRSSRACRPSRWRASAAIRATAAAMRRRSGRAWSRSTRSCGRRATPSRRGHPQRSHLRRLDADALPHARDLRQRVARRDVLAARPGRRRRAGRGLDACALWVEVTVVSDAVPGQIVIDAGSKTLTSDTHPDGGNGVIVGWPDADLHTINEEHGYVDVSRLEERPAVGDHLRVIPNHACGCVNLHDGPARRARRRRRARDPVAARGLVR